MLVIGVFGSLVVFFRVGVLSSSGRVPADFLPVFVMFLPCGFLSVFSRLATLLR